MAASAIFTLCEEVRGEREGRRVLCERPCWSFNEYAYRFNSRDLCQQDKFNIAVFQSNGRRLTYRALIGK